jgi:hypothetical protein
MTLAIAVAGPNAGKAVFEGLRAAEKIGSQSIGGFAILAALTEDGRLIYAETQRGGSSTLFVEGERCGVDPPVEVCQAPIAAMITSGPDRPAPLKQFLVADPAAGIVTGHRLPNALSMRGNAMNVEVLEALRAGRSAREAVDLVVGGNPAADCGLIAMDHGRNVYGRNSERVLARPDVHQAQRSLAHPVGSVIAFQNAIQPYEIVAEVAAGVALHVMRGPIVPDAWVTVESGLPVELGQESAVYCDNQLMAQRVLTTDPTILRGLQSGSAIYLDSKVYQEGTDVGRTVGELLCVLENGIIKSFSGQTRTRLGYRHC